MLPIDDHHPDDFPADLKPFEATLGSLVPASSRVDRDRLMYLSGAASATTSSPAQTFRLRTVFWPAATAAMLLVSLGLGALVAFRQPEARIVYTERPAADAGRTDSIATAIQSASRRGFVLESKSSDTNYLVLREQVLRVGVDAINRPSGGTGGSHPDDVRNRTLLNQFLRSG